MALSVTAKPQEITRQDADSLLSALNRRIPDKDRITALLQLASYNVHYRKPSDTMLRAADEYLRNAEQLSGHESFPDFAEQILVIRSVLYKAQGNVQAGKDALGKVITALKGGRNQALLGKAWYELSDFYSGNFLHETMQERIKYLRLAIAAYEQTNLYVATGRCYRFLADLHQMLNDNRAAFSEIRTALRYYDQAGYTDKQGAVALLGRIYYELGDYKQALNYELTALKIATNSKQDNVRLICQINNNIGYTYLKLKEGQKALQYFLESEKIAEEEKDNATVYLLAANVVDAYLSLNAPLQAAHFFQDITVRWSLPAGRIYEAGDYGFSLTYLKIYLTLREYDKARYYCDQLIRQASNPNINLFSLSLDYQLIARYYIETANYPSALTYLKKDKALVDSLRSFSGIAQNYRLWFAMDSASGKYKEAINDLIKVNEAKDSIFDEIKSKQIAQLEIEFESEKKESQINLLNQKAILESTKLRQTDFVKNVTIGGIVLLLLIAVLLYRQSNFRKRSNVIVTQKNSLLQKLLEEKEWLLKEVHHRVKNNLHTVICLLESQAKFLEKDALRAIESSQHRIYAMSLIHQKLYQSDNIGDIDTGSYLKELSWYLSESFGSPANIQLQLAVEDVKLNLSQAIPLGLIINEGITNAYKYAFPHKRGGRIRLELQRRDGKIRVIIADNGIGMHLNGVESPSKSLGLDLMRGLTDDLEGEIRFENEGGTKISLEFPLARDI